MLALPHHVAILSGNGAFANETRQCQQSYTPIYTIKGRMKAIVGDVWKLNYNMPAIGTPKILP